MTAVPRFRRRVTSYFRARHLLLQKVNGRSVQAEDDFAELYVLMRTLQLAHKGRVVSTRTIAGKSYYVVATSPSPSWAAASHFLLKGKHNEYALRSGIEVRVVDTGTVELDIILVQPSHVNGNEVDGMAISAALEVKNHSKKISSTVADHVRGKASRMHVPLPVQDAGDPHKTSRYCLVARHPLSANATLSVASAKIAYCDFGASLDIYLRRLLGALQI